MHTVIEWKLMSAYIILAILAICILLILAIAAYLKWKEDSKGFWEGMAIAGVGVIVIAGVIGLVWALTTVSGSDNKTPWHKEPIPLEK